MDSGVTATEAAATVVQDDTKGNDVAAAVASDDEEVADHDTDTDTGDVSSKPTPPEKALHIKGDELMHFVYTYTIMSYRCTKDRIILNMKLSMSFTEHEVVCTLTDQDLLQTAVAMTASDLTISTMSGTHNLGTLVYLATRLKLKLKL